jgi:hypothetical protein
MNIGLALDQLVQGLGDILGLPATRDPQLVRARIAQSGMCLTCSPPSGIGRALGGGVALIAPVHLVLPMPASVAQIDRAMTYLPSLCTEVGQWAWTWDDAIAVGADFHPGYSVDVELTVCEEP